MNLCNENLIAIYELIGIVLKIVKWIIPLILIAYGTFDFYQAVIKNEDNSLKKSTVRFIKRVISGLLILFLPTIILMIFNMIGFSEQEFSCIYNCILDTNTCEPITTDNNGTNNGTSNNNGFNNIECTVENPSCIDYSIYYDN